MGHRSNGVVHLGFIREPQDIGRTATDCSAYHEGHLIWMGSNVLDCGSVCVETCKGV